MQTAASVAIIVTLVSQAEKVNRTFKTDYAQSLLLTAVSMIAPLSIPFLVQLEDWKPATSEHVVLVKLFSLRLVNVCTLYYRLYMALAQAVHVKSGNEVLSCTSDKGCPDGFACCNTQGEKEWVFCTPDQDTPTLFRVFLQWLGNPAVLMGVILLLIFGLILMREKLVQTSFSFQARYNMFTTCCLLSLKQDGEQEKIRLLSKQVLES